jgi:adenylate cyclase class 2
MQEIEAKFYVQDLSVFHKKLIAVGAEIVHPRILEINLRFDTPNGDLSQQHKLLRLRQAHTVTLTYKGAAQILEGASQRQEIETEVGDFETTKNLLEAVGYQISRIYEKYRTEFQHKDLMITLDELPYGDFIEIEGPDVGEIHQMADWLGLDWSANVTDNYLMLLERAKKFRELAFRDLTFENFNNFSITPEDLGIKAAD